MIKRMVQRRRVSTNLRTMTKYHKSNLSTLGYDISIYACPDVFINTEYMFELLENRSNGGVINEVTKYQFYNKLNKLVHGILHKKYCLMSVQQDYDRSMHPQNVIRIFAVRMCNLRDIGGKHKDSV